jgi:predicted RNA binding protein YcfA (HicA-like mRNA interferase family)
MPRITPINWKKFCKILEKAGCVYSHTEGDHVIYHKKGAIRALVIPKIKDLPIFIILNNLKTAGISRTEYFKLLMSK